MDNVKEINIKNPTHYVLHNMINIKSVDHYNFKTDENLHKDVAFYIGYVTPNSVNHLLSIK